MLQVYRIGNLEGFGIEAVICYGDKIDRGTGDIL